MSHYDWITYICVGCFTISCLVAVFALYRGFVKSRQTNRSRLPVRFYLHFGLFFTLLLETANCLYLVLDPKADKHRDFGIGNGEGIEDWVYNVLTVLPAAFNLTTYSILIQMFTKIHYANHSSFAKHFSRFFILFNILIYLSFIAIACWTALTQNYSEMSIVPGPIISVWNILLSLCFIYFHSRLSSDLKNENRFSTNAYDDKNFSRLARRTLLLCYVIAIFALLRGVYGLLVDFNDWLNEGSIPVSVWRSMVHVVLFIPPAMTTIILTLPRPKRPTNDENLLWPEIDEEDSLESEITVENLCQPYVKQRETNVHADSYSNT